MKTDMHCGAELPTRSGSMENAWPVSTRVIAEILLMGIAGSVLAVGLGFGAGEAATYLWNQIWS